MRFGLSLSFSNSLSLYAQEGIDVDMKCVVCASLSQENFAPSNMITFTKLDTLSVFLRVC